MWLMFEQTQAAAAASEVKRLWLRGPKTIQEVQFTSIIRNIPWDMTWEAHLGQ